MNKRLSRRYVLRGAGVALALPWLEAMSTPPAAAQASEAAKRFVAVYMPNGAFTLWWHTTGTGTGAGAGAGDNWQLSPLLAPFSPVKLHATA